MSGEQEFMNKLEPYSYKYDDPSVPGATEGEHLGVMAQDMEKSKLGKALVTMGADGVRRYDQVKATNLTLASLAYLNKRVNELEGRKKK